MTAKITLARYLAYWFNLPKGYRIATPRRLKKYLRAMRDMTKDEQVEWV